MTRETKLKNNFQVLAGLLTAALFIWLAFRNVDLASVIEVSKGMSFGWIPFLVGATLLAHFMRAQRWRLLFADKTKLPPRTTLFTGVMLGYLANIVFARLGEIIRPVYVAKQIEESSSKLIGTIVLERIIDVITLLLITTFVFFFLISDTEILSRLFGEEFLDPNFQISILVKLISAAIIVLLVLISLFYLLKRLSQSNEKAKSIYLKVTTLFKTFVDGVLAIRELKNWPLFLLYTAAIWFFYILMTFIPFWMFDLQVDFNLTFADAVVLTIASAVGIMIPTPGGIGTYHLFITQALFILYAVPESVGLAYATITHTSTLLVIIIFTPLFLAIDKWVVLKSNVLKEQE